MSVEYRSGIAKGFKLTREQVYTIPEEIRDELFNYCNLLNLNLWTGDGDYILAYYSQYGAEAGYAECLDEIEVDQDEKTRICNLFHRYFPDLPITPKTYLFTEVF